MRDFLKVIAVLVSIFWVIVACNVYAWMTHQYGLALIFGLFFIAVLGLMVGAFHSETKDKNDDEKRH